MKTTNKEKDLKRLCSITICLANRNAFKSCEPNTKHTKSVSFLFNPRMFSWIHLLCVNSWVSYTYSYLSFYGLSFLKLVLLLMWKVFFGCEKSSIIYYFKCQQKFNLNLANEKAFSIRFNFQNNFLTHCLAIFEMTWALLQLIHYFFYSNFPVVQ